MAASSPDPHNLLALPDAGSFVRFSKSFGTRFLLIVDAEEEFDWSAPFNRESRSVTIMDAMARGQRYFRAAGMRPLYVVDYPVIDHPVAGAMLAGWQAAGEADIGAHCHPWVNPPFGEEVSARNSFAGNLPESLERSKITALRDRICEVTGRAPMAFRAGRYGAGPNTGAILAELGFKVDTSVRSRFNYSREGGPDYSGFPVTPYRAGPGRGLIELPLSTAWCGALSPAGDALQPVVEKRGLGAALLARGSLLQRVPLSPEGVSPAEAIRGVDRLLSGGLQLLLFSFHSPSLAPGNTPYVRNDADLVSFYRWWDEVLRHLRQRGVTPVTLDEIVEAAA